MTEASENQARIRSPDIKEGQQYYFRVSAVNQAGTSKPSVSTTLLRIEDAIGTLQIPYPISAMKLCHSIAADMSNHRFSMSKFPAEITLPERDKRKCRVILDITR